MSSFSSPPSYEHSLFFDWLDNHVPSIHSMIEIGIATGASTKAWNSRLAEDGFYLGIDVNLYDPEQHLYGGVERVIEFYKSDERMHFIIGNSMAPETVQKAKELLQERKVDILFIDGEHSYEAAKKDCLNYMEFVRSGGLIVWHDATKNTNVRTAIEDIIRAPEVRHKYGSLYELSNSQFKGCCSFDSATGHCGIRVLIKK